MNRRCKITHNTEMGEQRAEDTIKKVAHHGMTDTEDSKQDEWQREIDLRMEGHMNHAIKGDMGVINKRRARSA